MGVGEALDEHAFGEPLVARGKHYIYKNDQDNPTQRRLGAQELYMGPLFMFQLTELSLEDWMNSEQGIIKYAQFPVFLLNFPLLFFSGGSPVSIKWLSHVLYGKFHFFFHSFII